MGYMEKPRISIIAALAKSDRAIGRGNRLLWDIPEDMLHFRETTTGHTVIMGAKTFHSIGKALPKRTNIVLSMDTGLVLEGCIVVHSVEEALSKARELEKEEVFVIGGAIVYEQMMPFADRLHLTLVEGNYPADTFFPEYQEFSKVISEEKVDTGKNVLTFLVLEKE